MLRSLRNPKGFPTAGFLELAVADTVLAELLLDLRISVDDRQKQFVDVRNAAPTGNPILASAWIPLAMSIVALTLVIAHAAIYGTVHEVDEDTPSHLFRILVVLQIPIVAYFVIRWLPGHPRKSVRALALQAGGMPAALAAAHWLT